ncbi:SRPBCC family protein [Martelella radicis]|uniref:Uncharacterized protein YndB with AHSA1/START domain n=1 Tax=Martelella radicis TaxID=1397476 RepID=A0A7W6KGS4_9HYPH|nr:SRPBCC domain-containing protein [Martelella radicis]MBB4121008.1 uncharacterized protein YndB with AHSA1/START domain [Martelella radicis]
MPQSDQTLVITRQFSASPETVFDAWTDPNKMRAWWGLKDAKCPTVEIDLRIGGAYRIANELPGGRIIWITGYYKEISRPSRLTYSWSVDEGPEETVAISFEPNAGGTCLTIHHEGITSADIYAGHQTGWTDSLSTLAAILA